MAIICYPIFYYNSNYDLQMNFPFDLKRIGMEDSDILETDVIAKGVCPNQKITIILKKFKRELNTPPYNDVSL
jgi:hypothetical protein